MGDTVYSSIPQAWIKRYVDQVIEMAGKLDDGGMRDATLLRAEHAMDLVRAWQSSPIHWKREK